MRYAAYILLLAGLVFVSACRVSAPPPQPAAENRTLIIFYDPQTGKQPLLEAVRRQQAEVLYDYKNFNGMALSVPPGQNIQKTIRLFEKVPGVLSVQQDKRMQLM
ncbi:hypothetical protein [Candidatus Avelusimicrobium alvi]|uniref:hypothetical protein n=1 Tax=Candidatus Avelusimicrobium alvi TaxID=3416221 RepID=UPI003D0BB993